MPRYARKFALLAETEVTYGTDPVPLAAANSILLRNVDVQPIEAQYVDRELIRPFFGNSEQLLAFKSVLASFETELVGSGVLGTAPKWSPLLKACGFAETVDAGVRVDYLPVTDAQSSIAMYMHDHGVKHVLLGGRGTARLRLVAGEMPVIAWQFRGLFGPVAAEADPTPDYTGWTTPEVPNDANTADMVLGATLNTTGAPVFTGGTAVPSLGLEIDLANEFPLVPLIGGESVDITDRKVGGNLRLDLTAAQEVARLTDVQNAVLSSIGMLHGTAAARRVGVFMPSAQFTNPRKDNFNGRRLIQYDIRAVPPLAGTGNDELRIVCG